MVWQNIKRGIQAIAGMTLERKHPKVYKKSLVQESICDHGKNN
jgi:hypothetical protein